MHALGLKARIGVWPRHLAVEPIAIACPRSQAGDISGPHTVGVPLERNPLVGDSQLDVYAARRWRPDPEVHTLARGVGAQELLAGLRQAAAPLAPSSTAIL